MLGQERVADGAAADRCFYRELLTDNYPLVQHLLRVFAKRNRLSPDEADELGSIVRLKLVDNDYAVLRKYEGRSSLATYLTTVISRVHLDCRAARWGRWRPSARARRLGKTAVRLEALTERDRMTFAEACEVLWTNCGVTETAADLEAMHEALPRRVRRRIVGDDALQFLPAAPPPAPATEAHLERLAQSLSSLPASDRRLLQLRFAHGWTIGRIASSSGLAPKPTYRRFGRLLRQLRQSIGVGDGVC